MVERLQQGELLGGRYRVLGDLGRGGMAIVQRALDDSLGCEVAVKRLRADPDDPQYATKRRLFEHEYETLIELDHPTIVRARDYHADGEDIFYVMELLDGSDMTGLVPLPYPRVCAYLRDAASALSVLHARRLIHRDVTPRNLRATEDGRCKLFDFGALAPFGKTEELVGTPPYVPPEVLAGKELDQGVDLFALGCVAYNMLTGQTAYKASKFERLQMLWAAGVEPPSRVAPEHDADGNPLPPIPEALDRLVLSMLRPERLARPASAAVIMDRLEAIAEMPHDQGIDVADAYLHSAPLVGREHELRHLDREVASAPGGHGSTLLVEGDAGTGKTRLLRSLGVRARLRGASVMEVNASMSRGPYGTVQALAEQLLQVMPGPALETACPDAAVLGHLAPQLAERFPDVQLATLPAEPVVWRSRALAALRRWWVSLSERRPIVLVVDNVQRCDEQSALMLAALAHEARNHPIVLVLAQRLGDESIAPAALESLREAAEVAHLRGLDEDQTLTWLGSIFGSAEGLAQLTHDLHRRTLGNPAHIAELLRYLIQTGRVTLHEGTWRLPHEPTSIVLPDKLQDVLLARLEGLDEPARRLAQALSMYRGPLTRHLCERLADARDRPRVAHLLEELQQHKVLVAEGKHLRLAQRALRSALQGQIPESQRAELHHRVAEAMLDAGLDGVAEQLQAGVHLVEAGDERGVELIGEAGVSLVLHHREMAACVPLLERALELFRAQGRSSFDMATVLAPLTAGAYLVDRRLDRHADEAMHHLQEVSGLATAHRLRGKLGFHLSTLAGIVKGFITHVLSRDRRQTSFADVVTLLLFSVGCLSGKAAICLDRPAIEKLIERIAPLGIFPRGTTLRFGYDYSVGLAMITQDHFTRCYAHWKMLERLVWAKQRMWLLPDAARTLYHGGCQYVLGVLDAFAASPRALERADALDGDAIDVHHLIAANLRMQYHAYQGDAARMRHFRERVEAWAVQTGSAWQVQTWDSVARSLLGAVWDDMVIAKSSVQKVESSADELPSLAWYRQMAYGLFMLVRGQAQEAVEALGAARDGCAPFERHGWAACNSVLSEALNELGDHARAREVCEELFARVDPEDRRFVAHFIKAEVELAVALAGLGEQIEARAHLERLFRKHEPQGNALILGLIHEAGARIAREVDDREALGRHVAAMERHFRPLNNPALIVRYKRLFDAVEGQGGGSGDGRAAAHALDGELAALRSTTAVAQRSLETLMATIEGLDGYLFVRTPDGSMRMGAATVRLPPPMELGELVHERLVELGSDEDETLCGTEVFVPHHTIMGRGGERLRVYIYLLSFCEGGEYHGEGALACLGNVEQPPQVAYENLQVIAQQLARVRISELETAA